MEITANPDQEALDHFKIDLKDAEKNSKRYSEAVLSMDRKDQRELFDSSQKTGELAAFAIGIKPSVMIDDRDKKFVEKFVELTEGEASLVGDFLVWKDKAVQVIQENKDVFTDFNDSMDTKEYIERTLTGKDVSNKDYKLGLLLGYPKDASEAFTKYMDKYASFFRTVYSDIISGTKPFDQETINFFKDFVHNGSNDDIDRSNRFRDLHEAEAFEKIRGMENFKDLTDEELKYICSTRGVQSKGLNYMGMSNSENYTKIPKYVDRIFSITGMDNEITKIQEELMTLDYESDYPMAVDSVAVTLGSILSSHMSWGIMTDGPETKIKADFKEIHEGLAGLVAISRERKPSAGVDQFEKDFGEGLTIITEAITNAVHENGGLYMMGTFREVENIKDLNWVAKEALEILKHAGQDVAPIIDKIKSEPDISTVDAAFVFKEVFPKPVRIIS